MKKLLFFFTCFFVSIIYAQPAVNSDVDKRLNDSRMKGELSSAKQLAEKGMPLEHKKIENSNLKQLEKINEPKQEIFQKNKQPVAINSEPYLFENNTQNKEDIYSVRCNGIKFSPYDNENFYYTEDKRAVIECIDVLNKYKNSPLYYEVFLYETFLPTKGQPYFEEAYNKLKELISTNEITIIIHKTKDRSATQKKVWGEIYNGEMSINLELIKLGFAVTPTYDFKRSSLSMPTITYINTQEISRKDKVGLWSQENINNSMDFFEQTEKYKKLGIKDIETKKQNQQNKIRFIIILVSIFALGLAGALSNGSISMGFFFLLLVPYLLNIIPITLALWDMQNEASGWYILFLGITVPLSVLSMLGGLIKLLDEYIQKRQKK